MRFGLILASWIYDEQRQVWAQKSFNSLAKTKTVKLDTIPVLQFTYKPSGVVFTPFFLAWSHKFLVSVTEQPKFVRGLDPTLIWSADKVFAEYKDVTHVMFIMDDYLFKPTWLKQLEGLIDRHPKAKAYSVYRSANSRHHWTVKRNSYGDHKVTSISGIGAVSREEWMAYKPDWKLGHGHYNVPENNGGGYTVDLHHPWARPGDRWVTDKSYIQHIGVEGIHCGVGVPERALNFHE